MLRTLQDDIYEKRFELKPMRKNQSCRHGLKITDEWLFNHVFELDTSDDKGGISRYHGIQDLDGDMYRLKIMLRPYEENYLVFIGDSWIGRMQYRSEVIKLWEAVMRVPWESEKI